MKNYDKGHKSLANGDSRNRDVSRQKSEVAKIYSGGHGTLFVRLEIESLDKRSCQKNF